jgi:curved DNA-binding protein CbpA
MKTRTYYDILQVARDASNEVISSAYRTLMRSLRKHPDLGGDPYEASLIGEAYNTLSDQARRAAYDANIGEAERTGKPFGEDGIERRRTPRRDVDAKVSFCIGNEDLWHAARVRDISILGLRLQARVPFGVGNHLIVAPESVKSPAVHGTVRWQRMFHPNAFERIYEAGIEFSDQITDIEDRICRE